MRAKFPTAEYERWFFLVCRNQAIRVLKMNYPNLLEDGISEALIYGWKAHATGASRALIAVQARHGAIEVLRRHRGQSRHHGYGFRDAVNDAVSLQAMIEDGDNVAYTQDLLDPFAGLVEMAPRGRPRDILRMCYYDGMTDMEIAAKLGLTGSRIHQLRKAALAALKAHLTKST